MPYYQRHIFFCTNLRRSGKKCCAQGDAEALRQYTKNKLKKVGLHGKAHIRTSTSGCLGRCSDGPVVVIYPDNIWYHYQSIQDIDEIIEQHLINSKPVERLLLVD